MSTKTLSNYYWLTQEAVIKDRTEVIFTKLSLVLHKASSMGHPVRIELANDKHLLLDKFANHYTIQDTLNKQTKKKKKEIKLGIAECKMEYFIRIELTIQ